MPAILERLVSQLVAKGKSKSSAYAIATSQLQKHGELKPGTQEATSKGTKRGAMTPSARAKDRAAKKSRRSPKAYEYNANTNRATLKNG